jgi:hypothetical protein
MNTKTIIIIAIIIAIIGFGYWIWTKQVAKVKSITNAGKPLGIGTAIKGDDFVVPTPSNQGSQSATANSNSNNTQE